MNKVRAIASEAGLVNLPDGASASLVTTECVYTDNLTAPIEKGQKVGVVEIYIAGDPLQDCRFSRSIGYI